MSLTDNETRSQLASESMDKLAKSWSEMTGSLSLERYSLACQYINEPTKNTQEIRDLQSRMEREPNIGQYATLLSRYCKLMLEDMRAAVVKAMFKGR